MSTRFHTVIVAAAATAAVVAGCGSDDGSDRAGHSSESASAASSEAVSTTTDSSDENPAVAAPEVDALTRSLELLVARDVDVSTKAAAVENGQARLTNFETMTAALAGYGDITFEVGEPTVEGETAIAPVAIATPRGTAAPTPNTWVLIDGEWKVSETSACALLAMGQAPCA